MTTTIAPDPVTTTYRRTMLKRAVEYVAFFKLMQENYREACERNARKGRSPHYCIHGVNLWTDYDPICGQCEDGPFDPYRLAREAAKADVREVIRRTEWIKEGHRRSVTGSMPHELFAQLVDWQFKPVTEPIGGTAE